ncbi:MAG: MBL fold metallo-hydrolase [Acholeplasmataceae bacterium]
MKQFKGDDIYAHTYLICRFDTCYLIDPAHSYEAISKQLESKTLAGILLTHAHNDHIDLIGYFDVPIYIHKEDAYLLFEDKYNGYHDHKRPFNRKQLDLKLISDHMRLPLADQFVEVIHTPGHTKGSVCYLYDDKLFTGDTLFKDSVGRHDLHSGSLADLKKSILSLATLDINLKIYPGHDATTTLRNELKQNPFVLKWQKQKSK